MLIDHEQPPAVRALVVDDADALIKEARGRTRRRRGRIALVLLLVGAAALAFFAGTGGSSGIVAETASRPFVDVRAFNHDGELAFVSKGQLWVLNGDTNDLVHVSRGSQQAADPQFSPNGRWLSYLVDSSQLWLARSDGALPRYVASGGGVGGWLPNGRLVAGSGLWTISSAGIVTRVATVPRGLAAWSPDGGRYVFFSGSLGSTTKASTGTQRLEVASSLNGKRTTWYTGKVSFTPSGAQGNFLLDAVVLPAREGILFQFDYGQSADLPADGLELYELRAPGARPKPIGVTVGLPIAIGANGTFALTNGGNRYAWLTKSVETCLAATARCTPVPTAHGELSFDPAWSPNGKQLAFVDAPTISATNFFQATVERWYATHSLWILQQAGTTPSEIQGSGGASAPTWSANGKSVMYVANDALWLLPTLSSKPVRIASPLFTPNDWQSFFGEISWSDQFAWLSHP
jgi:TolB protein